METADQSTFKISIHSRILLPLSLFIIPLIILLCCGENYLWTHEVTTEKIVCDNISDEYVTVRENDCFGVGSERRIFFVETSEKGGLDSRQACAVESTSKANPNWDIFVFLSKPFDPEDVDDIYSVMQSLKNVKLVHINLTEFFLNEDFQYAFQKMEEDETYRRYHSSDIMRILLVNKYGGMYMDLDVVVVKSFDSLPNNFLVKQSRFQMSSGVMRLSKYGVGGYFSSLAVRDLRANFDPTGWQTNGPDLVQRTLEHICDTPSILDWSAQSCYGIEVFDRRMFYPIKSDNWILYYKRAKMERKFSRVLAHHVWGALGVNTKIRRRSLYAKLAQQYCPLVYDENGEDFGRKFVENKVLGVFQEID